MGETKEITIHATIQETIVLKRIISSRMPPKQMIEFAQDEANEASDGQIFVPRIEIFDESNNTLYNGL